MAHTNNKIDRNKVERVETPYGNGYYYNGRLYNDDEFAALENENNNNNYDNGGPKPAIVDTISKIQKAQQGQVIAPAPGDPPQNTPAPQEKLPGGYTREQINQLYSTGSKGGMNQAMVQAFEREYGTGFRPGQPASQPADPTPPLATMMDSNFSHQVPADMNPGTFYGNYDDVVVRNGQMAKGVNINPTPGDYQIQYENPIYENALKGNWTGQNVDTQVMPQQGQPTQQQTVNTGQQQQTSQAQTPTDSKPVKQDGHDYTNEASTFSAAFSAARQAGLTTFKYKGNVHTTEMAQPKGASTGSSSSQQKQPIKMAPDQRSMKLDESKNKSSDTNKAKSFTDRQTSGTPVPENRPAGQKTMNTNPPYQRLDKNKR